MGFEEKVKENILRVYEGCGVDLSPCIKDCGHQKLNCPFKVKVQVSNDKRGLKREVI